jgi:uncharacterized membrane protein
LKRHTRAVVAGVLACCAVFVLFGFLNKARCFEGKADPFYDQCYTDFQPLFYDRLFLDRGDGTRYLQFPYVDGYRETMSPEGTPANTLKDGAIEYPVLTGLVMWVGAIGVEDGDAFLKRSALFLAPFAFVAAYLLVVMTGWRALMWAAAPAVILYAFHNWDLPVVAVTVAGFYLWSRGSPLWAAAMFGVGAAFKMYPLMFVAPLVLDRWMTYRDRIGAVRVAVVGAGTFLMINIPFMIVNFDGWIATYSFHSARGPNFDSIWCAARDMCLSAPGYDPKTLNLVTLGLTALFGLGILGVGLWRFKREQVFPFVQCCGAMMATFLLWNKVHSPQYTLWLLPFFVLIGRWKLTTVLWALYAVADAYVYWGIFRWFTDYSSVDFPNSEKVMLVGIWMRAALLLFLVGYFVMARRSYPRPPAGANDRSPLPEPDPRPAYATA